MISKDFCTETKIVGVTKLNDHNIPIQSLLPSLKEGDRIILIRDYGNEYDENAIKIYNRDGNHIGYLSASLAENISPFLEENPKYDIEGVVRCVTGGTDGKSYGCNITVWIQDPDEPSYEELHAFAKCMSEKSINANKGAKEEQYYKNQAIIEQEQKMRDRRIKRITVIVLLILVVFAVFIAQVCEGIKNNSDKPGTSQERGIDEHLITLNEYNLLRIGMSRTEVYDIVGSFGTKTSETGQASDDYHIVMYSYEGYGDTGANAQLMFINGKLDTMAQYGLANYYGKEYGGESSSESSSSYVSSNIDNYWSESPESSANISSSVSSKPKKENSQNNSSKDISSSITSNFQNKILVKVTDIDLNTIILAPNSIGTIWMEATYTNNSNYAISSLSYKYLCKDTNETHYLSTYDTVLSGETSPIFDGFGPESGKQSDIEFLTCDITVIDKTGDKVYIEYDYQLDSYKTY